MTVRSDIVKRTPVAARKRRAAAAGRRILQASRDRVERSRQQARAAALPPRDGPAAEADDPGPSQPAVERLPRVCGPAEDEGETRTRSRLGRAMANSGHRIAVTRSPRPAGIVMH